MNHYEFQMLRVLGGHEDLPFWGAWCTVCLEYLVGSGYAVHSPYRLTAKGKKYLEGIVYG